MTNARLILTTLVIITLISITSGSVFAQSHPQQYYGPGGGEIDGYVLGVNKQPYDWAAIYANNGQQPFEAFSGMSGFYEMRVPAATYNVTIKVPGYEALVTNTTVTNGSTSNMNFNLNSMNVTVSSGSSSVINFYLEQNQTPVPEFQPSLPLTLITFIFIAIFMIRRSKKMQDRFC